MQEEYTAAQRRLAHLGVNDDILRDDVKRLKDEIKALKLQNRFLVKDCRMMAYVINQLVDRAGINFHIPEDSIMAHLKKTGYRPVDKKRVGNYMHDNLPF